MALKVTNNAQTKLAAGIAAGDTSLTVTTGDGAKFPVLGAGDWHPLTLFNAAGAYEILRVTGRSGDTMTVARGQENTTALAWNTGDGAQLRLTNAAFAELLMRDGSVALTGDLNANGHRVTGLADPQNAQDAVTKNYAGILRGRNRIINGAMMIDQWNNGAAITPTANAYCVDRWVAAAGVASKLTFQQVADAPTGFNYSLKATVAAQYAPAAGDNFGVIQLIEGLNVIDFAFGTSGATYIALSAQVKSSVPGTYACRLCNNPSNRSYVATYTIPSANTWTPLVLVIQGDVTGTWVMDNTAGLQVYFDLGCGSNFNAPSAGSWQAGNYVNVAGSTLFVNQPVGSTWQITGVQVEKGATATAFENRLYSDELELCYRYYQKGTLGGYSTSTYIGYVGPLSVTMRNSPTVTFDDQNGNVGKVNTASSANVAINAGQVSALPNEFFVDALLASSCGNWWRVNYIFNAEL